ncbi:MAG: hypothetical protein HWN67_04625 [Candidatus Helarchaeota archaeon]|nr:hypothetical protein [Candidatus Helarchaeota archaeon]
MNQSHFSHMFRCRRCNQEFILYQIKAAGRVLVIKCRCPKHGSKSIKLPLAQKSQYISDLHGGVFRCYKCGAPARLDNMKLSGPWTLIRMVCDIHGSKLPVQKISSPIYNEIVAQPVPQKAITTHISPGEKVRVVVDVPPSCPFCKAPINRDNVQWAGPMSVKCPYCERTVPAAERQI